MATKQRKTVQKKPRAAPDKSGAAAALAERTKDAKKSFGKAAPKQVKPAAHAPAKSTAAKSVKAKPASEPSLVARGISGVGTAVKGVASAAASVFRKAESPSKTKAK